MENKRAKVIMLPTDKSRISRTPSGTLTYTPDYEYHENSFGIIAQHLYFTTDEEIKEGDWFIQIHQGNKTIVLCDKQNKNVVNTHQSQLLKAFKIIATTDTKLKIGGGTGRREDGISILLPQPSQAFIEKYCKVGGIDGVLVEYENKYIEPPSSMHSNRGHFELQLKVNSHNEITIHPIKDSWTREEVIEVINNFTNSDEIAFALKGAFDKPLEITDEWIKTNL